MFETDVRIIRCGLWTENRKDLNAFCKEEQIIKDMGNDLIGSLMELAINWDGKEILSARKLSMISKTNLKYTFMLMSIRGNHLGWKCNETGVERY